MTRSYGVLPDLLNAMGLGYDRTLGSHKIGEWDFLLQKGDTASNQKMVNRLTSLLDARKGSLEDTDINALRDLIKQVDVGYTPLPRGARKGLGDVNQHERTATIIDNAVLDKAYYTEFEGESYPSLSGDSIKYTDITENVPDDQRQGFQENWKMLSAIIYHTFNDNKLVPKGGVLSNTQITTLGFQALLENGFLKPSIDKYLGFISDVKADYTRMTPTQIRSFFNDLPDRLNELTAENLTEEQINGITESINKNLQIQKETELSPEHEKTFGVHPITFAKNAIEQDVTFNSIEDKNQKIKEYISKFTKEDIWNEDAIQEGAALLESIEISEDIPPPEDETDPQKWNRLAKKFYGKESYLDLSPAQFEDLKAGKASFKAAEEIATNIQSSYYHKLLPWKYNYSVERFWTRPEDLDTVREMEEFKTLAKNTPFDIAKEWWKEKGINMTYRGFSDIGKWFLEHSDPSLLETFKDLNYDPVAFAFHQSNEELPDITNTLIDTVRGIETKQPMVRELQTDIKHAGINLSEAEILAAAKVGEDIKRTGRRVARKARSLLSKHFKDPSLSYTPGFDRKENNVENIENNIDKVKAHIRIKEGRQGKPVLKAYKLKGEKYYTIGFGHYGEDVTKDMVITKEKAEELLEEDILERILKIQKIFPDFDGFPYYLQEAMLYENFRGSLTPSGSPNTIELINEGKYREAAKQFLVHDEYINAKKLGKPGIRRGMKAVSEALNDYAASIE